MLCPWLKQTIITKAHYVNNGTIPFTQVPESTVEAFVPCQGSECPFYYTKKFPGEEEQRCRRSEIPREY